MNFDEVIAELGEFGPYQKRLYFTVCLVSIPAALMTLAGVFIQATPDHRCALPGLPNDTYASQGPWHDALVNASIPWDEDDGAYDECVLRKVPGDPTSETESCSQWVYSTDPYHNTVVTDQNLVCGDKFMMTYATMIFMAGMLFGSLLLGILSDIIGRKKVLVLGILGKLGAAFGVAWAESYWTYVILRFFVSFFAMGMFLSAFVIGMEMVGPSKRKIAGIVIEMFWCGGLFLQTAIAYGIRDWRQFEMVICIPSVIVSALFILTLPESPRWLLQKGRTEEAAKIVQMAAEKNGVRLSEKARTLEDVQMEGKGEKLWHMFTHPTLLARSLVIFFNWLVASKVYYGLSLNVDALSGDIYLNFFLSAVVELVSYFFCIYLLDRAGRKFMQCFSMLLGGVACLATMFPVMYGDDDDKWITTTLSLIGKFGASAGFAIIYVYSAELFPTVMRNSALGVCSMCARVGGILAPYIGDIDQHLSGDIGVAAPLIIFGGLSIMAGLSVLILPETSSKELPDTVEDAKNFGQSEASSKNKYVLDSVGAYYEKGKDNPTFRMDERKF